jgi:hypothetical protein
MFSVIQNAIHWHGDSVPSDEILGEAELST